MIVEEIQRPPFIHFGIMRQTLSVEIGKTFKVFQRNVYNDDYSFEINTVSATYENEFTASTVGVETFKGTLANKLGVKEVDGNIITLTVSSVLASSYKTLTSSNTVKSSGAI